MTPTPMLLLHGHAGALDYVGPSRNFDLHEWCHLGNRHVERFAGRSGDTLYHNRLGEGFFHFVMKLDDNRLRRLFWRPESEPDIILIFRHGGLCDGGHVRQQRRSLGATDGERTHRAALNLTQGALARLSKNTGTWPA